VRRQKTSAASTRASKTAAPPALLRRWPIRGPCVQPPDRLRSTSRQARTRFSPLIILPIPEWTGFARLRQNPHYGANLIGHGLTRAIDHGQQSRDLYLCSFMRKTRLIAAISRADRPISRNVAWPGLPGPRFNAGCVHVVACCTSRPDGHRIARAARRAAVHRQTITTTIRAQQDEFHQPEFAKPRALLSARRVCRS